MLFRSRWIKRACLVVVLFVPAALPWYYTWPLAVVSALVGDGDGPREIARATLIDVIDILAPIDLHTVRV